MNNENKKKRGRISIVRHMVQFCALILFLIPALACGLMIFGLALYGDTLSESARVASEFPWFGSFSSSSVFGIVLLDPFAMLQVICASKTFDVSWLLYAAPIIIVYALIRGRAFCGWVCPVNFVLEGIDWLRKKLHPNQKLKENLLPRRTKIFVMLGVLILSACISIPVFEIINPISFINKGLIFGSLAGAISLVAIIVLELFCGHRLWCRSICPLGGFYEILGNIGIVKVAFKQSACTHCNSCKSACLASPNILDAVLDRQAKSVCAGDCMICGKCIDVCPTHALSLKIGAPVLVDKLGAAHASPQLSSTDKS